MFHSLLPHQTFTLWITDPTTGLPVAFRQFDTLRTRSSCAGIVPAVPVGACKDQVAFVFRGADDRPADYIPVVPNDGSLAIPAGTHVRLWLLLMNGDYATRIVSGRQNSRGWKLTADQGGRGYWGKCALHAASRFALPADAVLVPPGM